MFQWIKRGRIFNPVEVKDVGWMQEFAQAPSVLLFDDFVRVYFSCRPNRDTNGQYISNTAYLDLDRGNLFNILRIARQPIIMLGETGTFDEFGIYPTSVIRDGQSVIAYYGGWTRSESVPFNVAIGRAVSHDNGMTFVKSGKGPVLSYSEDEPFVLSGPKIRKFDGRWYLFYIAGQKWINCKHPEPVYKIRMAFSNDGLNWIKGNGNLIENRIESDEAQASPDVFFHNGRYHMFFCYRYSLDYRCKERGYRIGYAFSEDLSVWERDDAKVGIYVSDEGWDSEMISYPHVFMLDNKIFMLYLGNEVGRYGFGLAELDGNL